MVTEGLFMTIDKLSGMNPLKNINKTKRAESSLKTDKTDSVQISSDAKTMGELYQIAEKVNMAPDIRQERIDEVMDRMKNPDYFNTEKLEAVAEKLTGLYNL